MPADSFSFLHIQSIVKYDRRKALALAVVDICIIQHLEFWVNETFLQIPIRTWKVISWPSDLYNLLLASNCDGKPHCPIASFKNQCLCVILKKVEAK